MISGITPTMPIIIDQYSMINATQAPAPTLEIKSDFSDVMNVSLQASVQVMDMANSAFEQAAAQLLEGLAQMTGVGQNFDVMV